MQVVPTREFCSDGHSHIVCVEWWCWKSIRLFFERVLTVDMHSFSPRSATIPEDDGTVWRSASYHDSMATVASSAAAPRVGQYVTITLSRCLSTSRTNITDVVCRIRNCNVMRVIQKIIGITHASF